MNFESEEEEGRSGAVEYAAKKYGFRVVIWLYGTCIWSRNNDEMIFINLQTTFTLSPLLK